MVTDVGAWVFVEPDASGHHLAYVGATAQSAVDRGHPVWVHVPSPGEEAVPAAFKRLFEHDGIVERRFVGMNSLDVFRVVKAALKNPDVSRVVVLDVDRWIVGVAFAQLLVRRAGILRVLVMRPAAQESTLLSRARFAIKTWTARQILRSAGEQSVGILSAPGTNWGAVWPRGTTQLSDFNLIEPSGRSKKEARHSLGIAPDSLVVGLIGVLSQRKNPALLLAALELAAETYDGEIVLLCVGPDADSSSRSLVGRRVRVILDTRYLPDEELSGAMSACDMVGCLYDNEGSSGIVTAAIAHRVPVIAAGAEGVTTMVRELRAGRTCDLDVAEISRTILLQAVDPHLPIEPIGENDSVTVWLARP